MKIYNFEDLVVWQLARDLVKDIYAKFATSKDYGFNNQIQRAVISIMNNIAEGFDKSKNSKDNKQLLSYLNISYGSCGEVKSMLYVAEDLDYINAEIARTLRERCTDLSIKLASFMSSLRNYDINKNNRTNSEAN
jgi:four helix bundle protein